MRQQKDEGRVYHRGKQSIAKQQEKHQAQLTRRKAIREEHLEELRIIRAQPPRRMRRDMYELIKRFIDSRQEEAAVGKGM